MTDPFAYDNTLTGVGYLDGLTITCAVVGPGYIPDPTHTTTAVFTADVVGTETAVAEVVVSGSVVVRIPDDEVEVDLGGETVIGGFVWSDPDDKLLCWAPAEPGTPTDPLTIPYPDGLIVVDQGA